MAKVTWTPGNPNMIQHSVSHGTGLIRGFHKGIGTDVSWKALLAHLHVDDRQARQMGYTEEAVLQDIAHYLSSGGFDVELSPKEAVLILVKKTSLTLSGMNNKEILAAANIPAKKVSSILKAAETYLKNVSSRDKSPEDELAAELDKIVGDK